MGQAGCQTTSQQDLTYIRSDMVRMRRDIEDIKQNVGPSGSAQTQDILRNQAAQREMLLELQESQQQTESRIEEMRYELSALKQEITNLKLNLINQMEALRAAVKGSSASPQLPSEVPAAPLASSQPPASQFVPAPAVPAQPASPPPPAPSATVGIPSVAPPKPPEPIDYTKLYDTAYEDYVRQNYSLARDGFEEYLRQYPNTDLADNAQYWIGECYFAEGKYAESVEAFKKVITRYPTGNKVPRAMLKAGYALLQLDRRAEADAMFQQVIDSYPLSSEADQAKAKLGR
jgi:tol-pal system protein YbgF